MSLYQKIADTYRVTGSIRTTSIRCECSRQMVRRVAITEGLYTTPRIEQIKEMTERGLTPEQIADRLGCTKTAIVTNMPYRRGIRQDGQITAGALRMRKHRERKKNLWNKEDLL